MILFFVGCSDCIAEYQAACAKNATSADCLMWIQGDISQNLNIESLTAVAKGAVPIVCSKAPYFAVFQSGSASVMSAPALRNLLSSEYSTVPELSISN